MYTLIALLFLLFSSFAAASPLDLRNMVIFGDSLSDTGNLYAYMDNQIPSSPPYFSGRFSNGPIWVELLANKVFAGEGHERVLDYAYGGAAVETEIDDEDSLFSLKHEVTTYLQEHNNIADPNSLFFIWIGANNYLNPPEDMTVEENAALVNANIRKSVVELLQKGAKHIALINLPDLSRTPFGLISDDHDILKEEVLAHNRLLLENFDELKQLYPDVRWFYFDAYTEVNNIIDNPTAYGFNNVEFSCYENQVDKSPRSKRWTQFARVKKSRSVDVCEGSLFFDPVHPTNAAHELIAEHIWNELSRNNFTFAK